MLASCNNNAKTHLCFLGFGCGHEQNKYNSIFFTFLQVPKYSNSVRVLPLWFLHHYLFPLFLCFRLNFCCFSLLDGFRVESNFRMIKETISTLQLFFFTEPWNSEKTSGIFDFFFFEKDFNIWTCLLFLFKIWVKDKYMFVLEDLYLWLKRTKKPGGKRRPLYYSYRRISQMRFLIRYDFKYTDQISNT